MAKTKKRRSPRKRSHQSIRSAGSGKRNINWMRIAGITIAVVIALSMLMSLVVLRR